jgi:hypothetical protein
MKDRFKILCLFLALLLLLPCVRAEVGYGFMNIANLVPGEDRCEIRIDGELLVPDGLPGGDYTGWFMVKPGAKSLKIQLGELDAASGTIQVVDGVETLVGIFLEPVDRLRKDGTPYPPKVRIKRLPAFDARGFELRAVSLCPEKQRFRLDSRELELEAYEPVEVAGWSGAGFEVFHGDQSIGRVAGSSESGAFYLLLGTDLQGGYASVLVSSDRQEVPEYLKPKMEKNPEPATRDP